MPNETKTTNKKIQPKPKIKYVEERVLILEGFTDSARKEWEDLTKIKSYPSLIDAIQTLSDKVKGEFVVFHKVTQTVPILNKQFVIDCLIFKTL